MIASLIVIGTGALVHIALIGIFYYGLDMGFTGVLLATGGVFVGRFVAG